MRRSIACKAVTAFMLGAAGFMINLPQSSPAFAEVQDKVYVQPERPDIPIFGIVTGKVKESDFCLPEDEKELKIIHADAIRQ